MAPLFSALPKALLACALVAVAVPAAANPQLASVPGARTNMAILEPFEIQGSEMPFPHQVTVALPASYDAAADRSYPVLWVLDSPMMLRAVTGILDILVLGNHSPEMIVIGVGSAPEEGLAGVGRRVVDFSPPGEGYAPTGLGGEVFHSIAPIPEFPHKADAFLAMLVDELRPRIVEAYRTSGEHALFGHSAGGMFAGYALMSRPEAFDKMIIGSPFMDGVDGAVFTTEERFAASHDDLPVSIFLGAGSAELDEDFLAVSGIVASTAAFSRRLHLRNYPSLELTTRIYEGEDHYTVVPQLLTDAIPALWSDEAAALGSSWPERTKDGTAD
ncbi:hypothetical protein B5C34_01790 [Pacificimonas flava]|uniref:Esterase n=2 Tax=Pacificimonas TaxID=1960290 RepID=A0A219B3B9_9SPHN|nr:MULTISPECIES: alpha/beta hydrolase-fold protein [Pacificimonas]MBZ6378050.1 alpha/beta hydrolase [Pacificimonas aurantium]OWV32308.1 hypothetical protein B5C34_01790 [Pacificimonas flava]